MIVLEDDTQAIDLSEGLFGKALSYAPCARLDCRTVFASPPERTTR